jgi:hypothetical protein
MLRLLRCFAAAVLVALGWCGLVGAAAPFHGLHGPSPVVLELIPPGHEPTPYRQIYWTTPPAVTALTVHNRLIALGIPDVPPPTLFLGREPPSLTPRFERRPEEENGKELGPPKKLDDKKDKLPEKLKDPPKPPDDKKDKLPRKPDDL